MIKATTYSGLKSKLESGNYLIVVRNINNINGCIVDDINLLELNEYTLIHKKHQEQLEHFMGGGLINGYINQNFIDEYNETLQAKIIPSYNGYFINVNEETLEVVVNELRHLKYDISDDVNEDTTCLVILDDKVTSKEANFGTELIATFFKYFTPHETKEYKQMWMDNDSGLFTFEEPKEEPEQEAV